MDTYFQLAVTFTAITVMGYISHASKSFFPPFYILAGIILGPWGLDLITDTPTVNLLGEIGVVFLLFYLGYEFSFNKLIEGRQRLFIAGGIDFLVNFPLGFAIGILLGFSYLHSFVMAGLVYMSSSGIITKTLIQLRAIKDPEGQLIMGIMVFEDLVMVVFLVVISSLMQGNGDLGVVGLSTNILIALAFCTFLLVFGRKYNHLLDKIISHESKELILLGFLSTILLVTAIGIQLGVSEALGSFFLGMVFSEANNKKQIERMTAKFRDIFGSIFFFSFGLLFDIEALHSLGFMVVTISTLAIIGKLVSSLIISRLVDCSLRKGLFIGLVTATRGEFSLLIAAIASTQIPNIESIAVFLVLSTALFTTVAFRLNTWLCQTKHIDICLIPNTFEIKE